MRSTCFCLPMVIIVMLCCCGQEPEPRELNPFTDPEFLVKVGLNSPPRRLVSTITPMGPFSAGQVIEILVQSEKARSAYVLKVDDVRNDAGVIIDGGPIGTPFLHRVCEDGLLFLFVDTDTAEDDVLWARVRSGPADFRKPSGQAVVLVFESDYLVDPQGGAQARGLFDPELYNDADRMFLMSIDPEIRDGILLRQLEIFEEFPVTFLLEHDPRPANCSVLTFKGAREEGEDRDSVRVAGCEDSVIFGRVLPRGSNLDAGNQCPNDQAEVYVGSFRDTQNCDTPFTADSINNIINTLALTAAHEIGHLLGLNHTTLDGLMARVPSSAYQRQLSFQRSQVIPDQAQASTTEDGAGRRFNVYTLIVQDPKVYFGCIFDMEGTQESDVHRSLLPSQSGCH